MCDCLDVCTCHVQTQGGPVSGRQHTRDTELDIMAGRLGPALGSESETQNRLRAGRGLRFRGRSGRGRGEAAGEREAVRASWATREAYLSICVSASLPSGCAAAAAGPREGGAAGRPGSCRS